MTIHTYLPQDRLRALANNDTLPDRTSGSALFADISGFTALTESLHEKLGARRGAEELSKQMEAVYTALISRVEKFGGSVISFSGDAMLCWFDSGIGSQGSGAYALGCAFEMQSAIQSFPALGLKVTVASGSARRFVVGDPEIQKIDAIAGGTIARTSTAEHHASKGEVILDEASVNALGDALTIQEWRADEETQERFAVISRLGCESDLHPSLPTMLRLPPANELIAWMPYPVFEREMSGQGAFLTAFRPCVALFVRFVGIDYDSDSAEGELDAFIRELQKIALRYAGTLLDITIGDKGSYAYVNFGALNAHEDDARRALKTALELRNKVDLQLQMGITQGLMRVGAYGGSTRKTYSALGDDVNFAARLMIAALAGEILVSAQVHKALTNQFTFEPRPPLPMKGKVEPLPVFAVMGENKERAVRLQEPRYVLPMVGRQGELQTINDKLDLTAGGKGQVIGIVAEAGLGKSRLVAEVIRSARKQGFVGYGGACQSDAVHIPYQAWKSIWQAVFDIDPEMALRKQLRLLESNLEELAPARLQAMPLLNIILDLNIPENEFTRPLEPKTRQNALHALLEDCLKVMAKDGPILIVIEDLHWIDALSQDLLEELARALTNHPICFVLAYRPPQLQRLQVPRLETLPHFTRIELHELTPIEAEQAIRAKLVQLYPARSGSVPARLVDTLMARAQGNPFYLEELLNYLRDRGLDPRDPADLEKIELPDSLHTLILSRIDQLSEQERATLRVASIIGRVFRVQWLMGYYPLLGTFAQVKDVLDALQSLDITPLESSEPELAYLFKHIVTHEVTYESLSFSTRARLHEQLAQYLENTYGDSLPVDILASHYSRSENTAKQRIYLRKAGEAAQRNYANKGALAYYEQLLSLLKDDAERLSIHMKRGAVLELLGQFNEAEVDFRTVLEQSEQNPVIRADAQFALGKLCRQRGDYELALTWLEQVKEGRTMLNDRVGLAALLSEMGVVLTRKGEFAQARDVLNESLALARETADKAGTALALKNLGNVLLSLGDLTAAREFYEQSLALRRELGDKQGIAVAINNLGIVADNEGDYHTARKLYEESLSLLREMGDKWGAAVALSNLGSMTMAQGDYSSASWMLEESLVLFHELGDKYGIALSVNSLGFVAMWHNDYAAAQQLIEESLAIRREIGDKHGVAASLNNLGNIAYVQGSYSVAKARYAESIALCEEMDEKMSLAYALLGLGIVGLVPSEHSPDAREQILHSLHLRQEMGARVEQISSLIGAAGLAFHEDNPQCAAQLLGAVESALETLHTVAELDVKYFHEQTLVAVRAALGESAFQSAWEEGSKWSLEEAVRRALDQ